MSRTSGSSSTRRIFTGQRLGFRGVSFHRPTMRGSRGLIGPRPEFLGRNAAHWSRCLNSGDRELRRDSLARLVDGSDDAIPVLAYLLSSVHANVRKRAGEALSRIGRKVVPAVASRCGGSFQRYF